MSTGCATGSSGAKEEVQIKPAAVPPLPEGVTLKENKDIQGVWLTPGFNFKGYDGLLLTETGYNAVERSNEEKIRTFARREVRQQLADEFAATGLFKKVATTPADLPPGKNLTMDTTIIEYEKGGGGARYFAGLYGAGQPVIKVRGQLRDADKLVAVYEIERSGEGAGARMIGAFMSDEDIQRNDIKDLAFDLANFVRRTAGLPQQER